jgi:hypothetical protein
LVIAVYSLLALSFSPSVHHQQEPHKVPSCIVQVTCYRTTFNTLI